TGAAGEYLNTATITDSDQYDPNTDNNTDTEAVTPLVNASWTVTKSDNPAGQTYAAVGDVITYEILVDNTGNVAIRSVVVTDPQATTGPTYASGDTNLDEILDVSETWIYSATYTVTQSDLDLGYFTNTASANGTYNDNTGTATPMTPATGSDTVEALQTIFVNNVTVTEGDALVFEITLSGNSTTDVTFIPSFTNVTTSNDDYTQTPIQYSVDGGVTYQTWISGNITIPSGTTEVLFVVPSNQDIVDENDEAFTLTVTVASGNTANESASATGTITDDDTAAVEAITDATEIEGTDLTHTVTMTTASATDETYAFSVTDVTATTDVDYTGTPLFSNDVTYD
ncbi:hypothetical protein ACKGJN_16245, partial [Gillisia sp. Q332]|uniref:DUF7507 domain-containing protein n=1 Tax=Gillisia xinjiangensis TaxID=3384765 RepID=UPI003919C8DD